MIRGMTHPHRAAALGMLAALAALGPIVFGAAPPEWPRFRGPLGNPVSTGRLPDTWSKTDNVEWAAAIPGRGWSSPIVSGKRVFVTAATTDGPSKAPQIGTQYSNEYIAELQKQGLSEQEIEARVVARDFELPAEVTLHYLLYCVDLASGKVNWQREYYAGHPPGGRHRKNSFTSETPVTDGTLVYVYSTSLGLWAYDMKGRQVWKTPLENLPVYGDFGTGASPVLAGNLLVIVSDNEKQQFIAAFDKKTGRELWRMPGMGGGPIPSPYAWGGLLYLNGGSGGVMAAVRPGASGTIAPGPDNTASEFVAWAIPRAGTYLPTQLAYDGAIYALTDTGILSRYDAATGKLGYRARIEGGIAFTASPWAAGGKIFCLNEEGKTFVIAAGETYQLLKANDLEEFALATPALVGDRLLLRTETRLYSIKSRR